MFYIDLDELDELSRHIITFSRNRFNLFSFRDREHAQLPGTEAATTKEQLITYLKQTGFGYRDEKIMLLTNLNVLGYNFNPVSFYFILRSGEPVCAVAEVSNTFREMKLYYLSPDCFKEGQFSLRATKYFYVSPFIDHDADFDFNLAVPGEKLNIRIDDYKNGERFFISTLTGLKKPLTNGRLLWFGLRFPLITIRIIGLIHWNALLLWIKKIPFFKKSENPHLQRGVLRRYENK
jgi:hypothetical protein